MLACADLECSIGQISQDCRYIAIVRLDGFTSCEYELIPCHLIFLAFLFLFVSSGSYAIS